VDNFVKIETMAKGSLHSQNIIACIWDFDKTLIPDYMQAPIFEEYGIDEKLFWKETNLLPEYYRQRGQTVSKETCYLNHLLSFIRNGPLKGLNNARLRQLGKKLQFYPGLPDFFDTIKNHVTRKPEYVRANIRLEHYIISTGLGEMIRGSAIAPFVDGIFACELIENPPPPYFTQQMEIPIETDFEISQVGLIVDNTIKTRYLFEINKGSNKIPDIDVNASVAEDERRIPFENMVYVADGPSDVPVFSVVKRGGGRTYAVYDPVNMEEFAQNDHLLQAGRIHSYGPADYTEDSSTTNWLRLHLDKICDDILVRQQNSLKINVSKAPRHLPRKNQKSDPEPDQQTDLFQGEG
jgi:hypothetical protein